jgi:hypothetical protein
MKKITIKKNGLNIDTAIAEGVSSFCKESGYSLFKPARTFTKRNNINDGAIKALIILFISTVIIVAATAQTAFGIKGGLSSYALTGDDQSYKTGFHAGGLVQIKLGKQFIFQPELLLSQEGNSFEEEDVFSGTTIEYGTYLNYVCVPLLTKLQTKGGFYAEAGPGLAFLLGANYKETGSPDMDVKNSFKSSNFFVGLGAGYQSKIGLGIGLRFNAGIANIAASGLEATKSMGGHISVFYLFKARKK